VLVPGGFRPSVGARGLPFALLLSPPSLPEVMMPRLDDLDPDVSARVAEAEERARTGTQVDGDRVSARELRRWIDDLRAPLDGAMDARSSREVPRMGHGSDKAAG
jgi:hypothetical protein